MTAPFAQQMADEIRDRRAAAGTLGKPQPEGVASIEPGCTCGGIAACEQCQGRDAALARVGRRDE